MRNVLLAFSVLLFVSALSVGCTRIHNEGKIPEAKEELPMQKSAEDAVAVPMTQTPDVDISPDAEIPSDKDVTNIKVPDVEVDATKGMGDMDDTRVDAIDDTVDEP